MIINNYEPFSTLFTKTLRRVSKVADLLYRNPKQTFQTAILSLFSGEGFFCRFEIFQHCLHPWKRRLEISIISNISRVSQKP